MPSIINERVVVTGGNTITLESGGTYFCGSGNESGTALNIAENCAAIGDNITFAGNTMTGSNSSDYYGGAVYTAGELTLTNSTFTQNFTPSSGGAAIYGATASTLNLTDCLITKNTEEWEAIVVANGTASLSGVSFKVNVTTNPGSAYNNTGTSTFTDVYFYGNTSHNATYQSGVGGVLNSGNITIDGSSFAYNVGYECGGVATAGVSDSKKAVTSLTDCEFLFNTSGTNGGALYVRNGVVTLDDVKFQGNSAGADYNGGAIYNNGGSVSLLGEAVLVTESDTLFNSSSGYVFWHLSDDACGKLTGYQYLRNAGALILMVDGTVEDGDSFTIASGDFTNLTEKDTFVLSIGSNDTYITIGSTVNFGGFDWTLAVTGAAADGQLVLTAGGEPEEPVIRADFNASGRSDVVTISGTKLYILADNAKGKYVKSKALSNLGKWTMVEPEGDYDGNSRADVLITLKGTLDDENIRTIGGLFNVGEGSEIKFKAHSIFSYKTAEWSYRGKGDVNGDGTTDIVIVLKGEKAVEMGLKGRVVQAKTLNENGKVGETVKMGMLKSGECVLGTADVAGNGTDNILIWNTKNDKISYWKAAGASLTGIGTAADMDFLGSGDLNGDGADELVWQDEDGTFTVWENLAGKSLKKTDLGAQKSGWTFQQLGDYNGDGKQELLWAANDGRLAYSGTDKITKLTVIAK